MISSPRNNPSTGYGQSRFSSRAGSAYYGYF
jgi:hypothetical protein